MVAEMYERVKYTNQIIYAPEHHQYITQHIGIVSLMSSTTFNRYILNPSMNVVVTCPQLYIRTS